MTRIVLNVETVLFVVWSTIVILAVCWWLVTVVTSLFGSGRRP